MNEYHIGWQQADNIFQAETINLGAAPANHVGSGKQALALHDYETAAAQLGQAVSDDPADLESHYLLSLALLGGRRPHMNPGSTIRSIERHLRVAATLTEARVLQVLVNEDYRLAWQHSNAVPAALVELVASVALPRAQEIIEHVPAEQSRVWLLLAARVSRGV
jgi:hypothetical protein